MQVRHGNFTSASGVLNFTRCFAQSGGGASVNLHVHAGADARMQFESCTTPEQGSGGGLQVSEPCMSHDVSACFGR